MGTLWQDIRYATRMLLKTPGLTAVIVITMALGIGANAVIFSIVNGVLLRPLPVPHAGRLVAVAEVQKGAPLGADTLSYADLKDFQAQTSSAFSALFGYVVQSVGLGSSTKSEHAVISYVTGNYFTGLGLKPVLGRFFVPGEGEHSEGTRPVVLSYEFWKSHFGGDPQIAGREERVNGHPATIIGVAPSGFHGTSPFLRMDAFLPLNMFAPRPSDSFWRDRNNRNLRTLGMLQPGVTIEQAQSATAVVAGRLAGEYPVTDKGITTLVVPETDARPLAELSGIVPVITRLFLVLAGFVLLLACMNVANVLLARATGRRTEMAIRAALGAPRMRLVRQMLTETLLLALAGGAAGVFLADWASGAISGASFGPNVPVILDFSFDWRVFSFALAAAVLAGVIAGLWPALRAGRADLGLVLHEGSRSDAAETGKHGVRNGLVVAQVAGSLMLLVAAGFFVRTLQGAQRMYMGFDPAHLVNVLMDTHEIGYNESQTKEFYRALKDRVTALPGVQSASLAFSVPMGVTQDGSTIYIENHPVAPGQHPPMLLDNSVDPDYFAAMRTPLIEGRAFTKADDEKAPQVAVINQAMARRFWPGEDAIGKRFSADAQSGPFIQVVGVAADGKYETVFEKPQPYFYRPMAQNPSSLRTLEVRSAQRPEALLAELQRQIEGIAPGLPVFGAETMEQTLGGPNGFFVLQFGALLAAAMGFLGLILAVVGVYGVVSYAASQRTHEIGIRMALGASPKDILAMVLRQGLRLVGAGILIGLAAGWLLTYGMAHIFSGGAGVLTFVAAGTLLGIVALCACYIPARRAMRLAPMAALRHE